MIKVHLIDGDPIARLECDRCQTSLLFVVVLEPDESPSVEHRRVLRKLAQKAGWTFMAVSVWFDGPRDFCPTCYTLPPEG
jgi:hypothetical protein